MWRSATARRTKTAAMNTTGAVRVCAYIRCATDEPRPRSIDAQAASIRAFIATQPSWHLIEPVEDAAVASTA
ncbi:hypothetical protein LWC34_53980 [Kibdelosporangium philippinense]|uniref:Resolvase/invertase-type recombinase catalytic domain-containing protein n=1 Tax=Kibdelosporangium philippinense TaxID=211113 RepID=A0ABS8ZZC7_9PSEU|nr:hypothetical protein [Kibdelosporangium philippinense]MCE7011667.1 hypothetical protein [Kibdelosporangium philippinense]